MARTRSAKAFDSPPRTASLRHERELADKVTFTSNDVLAILDAMYNAPPSKDWEGRRYKTADFHLDLPKRK
jgi:hypothetical protein